MWGGHQDIKPSIIALLRDYLSALFMSLPPRRPFMARRGLFV